LWAHYVLAETGFKPSNVFIYALQNRLVEYWPKGHRLMTQLWLFQQTLVSLSPPADVIEIVDVGHFAHQKID